MANVRKSVTITFTQEELNKLNQACEVLNELDDKLNDCNESWKSSNIEWTNFDGDGNWISSYLEDAFNGLSEVLGMIELIKD